MANLIIKPSTGGSNTLILQDEGGDAAITVGATGNTTLAGTANVLGTINATGTTFPTGHVLQVVTLSQQNYIAAQTTFNVWHSSAATVILTPSAATSRIFLFYDSGTNYQDSNVEFYLYYTFLRYIAASDAAENNTNHNMGHATNGYGGTYTSAQGVDDYGFNFSMHDSDAPGVTTPVRYRMYYRVNAGSYYHNLTGHETITAMEVA